MTVTALVKIEEFMQNGICLQKNSSVSIFNNKSIFKIYILFDFVRAKIEIVDSKVKGLQIFRRLIPFCHNNYIKCRQ